MSEKELQHEMYKAYLREYAAKHRDLHRKRANDYYWNHKEEVKKIKRFKYGVKTSIALIDSDIFI